MGLISQCMCCCECWKTYRCRDLVMMTQRLLLFFIFYITGSFWWQILMRMSNAKNVSVKYSRSALNWSVHHYNLLVNGVNPGVSVVRKVWSSGWDYFLKRTAISLKLSKHQSPTTVLFRTLLTRTHDHTRRSRLTLLCNTPQQQQLVRTERPQGLGFMSGR